jgi:hypothetical protein
VTADPGELKQALADIARQQQAIREQRDNIIRALTVAGVTDRAIGQVLGITNTGVRGIRIRAGIPPSRPGRTPGRTHGIEATYGAGCRCDPCRDAHRAYRLRTRERLQKEVAS